MKNEELQKIEQRKIEEEEEIRFLKFLRFKDVNIGKDHQAVRFPVFKDNSEWGFNYKKAEEKVFKGIIKWDPTLLKESVVLDYLT